MGTHIDGFFPYTVERSQEIVRLRLDAVFRDLTNEINAIRERGQFSSDSGGGWWLVNDQNFINGEGPSGFCISVYPAVVQFTSVERFGAIECPDTGIHTALRRVFEAVAAGFGSPGQLAVAAGGFGDTDKAGDLALSGAGFIEVCACLEAVIGPPAWSWEGLQSGSGFWYLKNAEAFSN